jgi:hypothetical protein
MASSYRRAVGAHQSGFACLPAYSSSAIWAEYMSDLHCHRRIIAIPAHRMSIARSAIRSSIHPLRSNLFTQARPVVKIGSSLSSTFSTSAPVNMSGAKQLVQQEIKDNFVMVFSKSYCPVSPGCKGCVSNTVLTSSYRLHSTVQPPRSSSLTLRRSSRTERHTRSSSKCISFVFS